MLFAGCGDSKKAQREKGAPRASYLLTRPQVDALATKTQAPAPAKTVLSFYRDIQFQNYAQAYLRLTRELRAQVAYGRFVNGMARLRSQLLLRPRVSESDVHGPEAVITVLIQHGPVLTQADQVIEFNLQRRGSDWLIGTDPYNVFQVAPEQAADQPGRRATPTATATAGQPRQRATATPTP